MILALMLLMQTAPEAQSTPDAASADASVPAAEAPESAQPKTKRVCRTVLDTRSGMVAKSRKICREVPDEPTTATAGG